MRRKAQKTGDIFGLLFRANAAEKRLIFLFLYVIIKKN